MLIEGLNDGGERTVRRLYAHLWSQMDAHLQAYHGKTLDDELTFEEFEQATLRAAVAFLMD